MCHDLAPNLLPTPQFYFLPSLVPVSAHSASAVNCRKSFPHVLHHARMIADSLAQPRPHGHHHPAVGSTMKGAAVEGNSPIMGSAEKDAVAAGQADCSPAGPTPGIRVQSRRVRVPSLYVVLQSARVCVMECCAIRSRPC